VEEAVRDLVRIGYDNVKGFAEVETLQRYFQDDGPSETIEEITFDDVETLREAGNAEVLDVRYRSEYEEGHVDGALNASYTRMPEYEADLPEDKTLLVHCQSGARAAAASAFLRRTGRDIVYINDNIDDYLSEEKQAVAA
jgi:hydroxyacylglutathione hydrolase